MRSSIKTLFKRLRPRDTARDFRQALLRHLSFSLGKDPASATPEDRFQALALAVRDRLIPGLLAARRACSEQDVKCLYIFSLEYDLGRLLQPHLLNLGLRDTAVAALEELGLNLDELAALEREATLGSGGLGRLATDILDSLATLAFPAVAYGILYEYGPFRQEVRNGWQQEHPSHWLDLPSPWLLPRPELTVKVPLSGRVEDGFDRGGVYHPAWNSARVVLGEPQDLPISGYGSVQVNVLRLFKARAAADFEAAIATPGDYGREIRRNLAAATISRALCPADGSDAGLELRLTQEYFLAACGVRDIVRRYRRHHTDWDAFADRVAIQINHSHPALVVVELQRYLVDEAGLGWEKAWAAVQSACSVTLHDLKAESLEAWPLRIFERLLPRHLQILYELNHRFLDRAREGGATPATVERLSLVEEKPERRLRPVHLALLGSHRTLAANGMHLRLLREEIFPDFAALHPDLLRCIPGDASHRRWLLGANPALATLLRRHLGDGWITAPDQLQQLLLRAEDPEFHDELRAVKAANRQRLYAALPTSVLPPLPPGMMFTLRAGSFREHRRHLLSLLAAVDRYLSLRDNQDHADDAPPRTFCYAGLAAPGNPFQKLLVKFVHNLAQTVNTDRRTRDRLRVHFLPDFRAGLAEILLPAVDLAEQLSLPGSEPAGGGNTVFALNHVLILGSPDGANLDFRDLTGPDVLFLFGLTREQTAQLRDSGLYAPRACVSQSPRLARVLDAIRGNLFSPGEKDLFEPILQHLLDDGDPWFILADFDAYLAAQDAAGRIFQDDPAGWQRRAVLGLARSGLRSSDQAVREYAVNVWDLPPLPDAPKPGA